MLRHRFGSQHFDWVRLSSTKTTPALDASMTSFVMGSQWPLNKRIQVT